MLQLDQWLEVLASIFRFMKISVKVKEPIPIYVFCKKTLERCFFFSGSRVTRQTKQVTVALVPSGTKNCSVQGFEEGTRCHIFFKTGFLENCSSIITFLGFFLARWFDLFVGVYGF